MTALSMCPHCGWNFEQDKPIEHGAWRLTPLSAELDGKPIRLSRSQAGILYAVAKAAGKPVSRDALLNRVSSSDDPNIVSVHVSRLRAALREAFPLIVVRGEGLAWGAPA